MTSRSAWTEAYKTYREEAERDKQNAALDQGYSKPLFQSTSSITIDRGPPYFQSNLSSARDPSASFQGSSLATSYTGSPQASSDPGGQYSFSSYDSQSVATSRPTPALLNWEPDSPSLDCYDFIVKGREPYFRLKSNFVATDVTPEVVYLDLEAIPKRGIYRCVYPFDCTGKQTVFTRPADLERHYKNVHSTQGPNQFRCDYSTCGRRSQPFTRKDHYRDHLRDYHKEDVGSAKKGSRNPINANGNICSRSGGKIETFQISGGDVFVWKGYK
ncbi:uncharacterized protein LY89DRAFT_787791 [Mollisia scopiformis]|uniref:C2H2-type domain-containing protein n=1 Tax=Mollisia scopiformis TaxID=149040 RepID=A0A132BE93_MOLSC|nr:uncharacterized protein LY89DRAFT_787791 [Mollisia scopiformis]KUJ10164.1 hypothetical protein LY89DRAFT_787791 [Mollisia scopiformis]